MMSKIKFSRRVFKITQNLRVLVQSLIRALLSLQLALKVHSRKKILKKYSIPIFKSLKVYKIKLRCCFTSFNRFIVVFFGFPKNIH